MRLVYLLVLVLGSGLVSPSWLVMVLDKELDYLLDFLLGLVYSNVLGLGFTIHFNALDGVDFLDLSCTNEAWHIVDAMGNCCTQVLKKHRRCFF